MGIELKSGAAAFDDILTPEALAFVADLHRQFQHRRLELLAHRAQLQQLWDSGVLPSFLPETQSVRSSTWQVAAVPPDLQKRRVEITGPAERKMMINALNSGASVFMADLEDSLSPTWTNVVEGQRNLKDAVRRTIEFVNPDGRVYRLTENPAVLLVRPRGWHLDEAHVLVDGEPISASLFDFGLYLFHNARELMRRGTGPYYYLPKLESHLEARLWNDVFVHAQDRLGIPQQTIRATVLIETILGAFELEEILYELRYHIAGLNAGRWDYIFSMIKKFRNRPEMVLTDRAQVTMAVPFMRAYTQLLVQKCHARGAHAIGGMAAFIPSRRDAAVNEVALAKVREDKEREAGDGFDGTWVAHPDLVPVAMEVFDRIIGDKPHQKNKPASEIQVTGAELVQTLIPGSSISESGVRLNISVALQYLASWLAGNGAAAINNLMEDAATAEISRAQLWQWIRHGSKMSDGRPVTRDLYQKLRDDELAKLSPAGLPRLTDATTLLDNLVLSDTFAEFLTIAAMRALEQSSA